MTWTRLIVVDKGRTQVYDVNGGKIVVASVRSVINGAVRDFIFDEVEWAASEFVDVGGNITMKSGDDIDLMGYYHPRRFLTMYIENDGDVRTVVNNGLQLNGWLKNNILVELEGLYKYIAKGGLE